jgi:starch phosphorylase
MCCADFDAYVVAQDEVERAFRDPARWGEMVVQNIANLGDFSSDRTILAYASEVWNARRIAVRPSRPE